MFPVQSTGDDDFPDFDPVLDAERRRRVRDEPPLTPGSHHPGLDTDKRLLVKPYQTLDAPLAILASYSTKTTTRHKYWGVMRDISNPSISILLAKIGFWDTTTRKKPVLMMDIFPRRINRKYFSSDRAEDLMKKLPRQLVGYWKSFAMDMLQRSSAKVVVVLGRVARLVYERFLQSSSIAFDLIWYEDPPSSPNNSTKFQRKSRPMAYLEYNHHDRQVITRLVLLIDHPEAFLRKSTTSNDISAEMHFLALQERLLDFANVLAYGDVHLPALLIQRTNYFIKKQVGLFILRSMFLPGHANELIALLRRAPTFYRQPDLPLWVQKHMSLQLKHERRLLELIDDNMLHTLEWCTEVERQCIAGNANALSLCLLNNRQIPRGTRCTTCEASRNSTDNTAAQFPERVLQGAIEALRRL